MTIGTVGVDIAQRGASPFNTFGGGTNYMARTVNFRLPAAILVAMGLILAIAAPAMAAPTGPSGAGRAPSAQLSDGEICGSVTAYVAPTLATDGSLTINGVTDPIAAGTVVGAALEAALLLATPSAPVTACLTLTVTGDGTSAAVVTGIAADASAPLCGAVTATGTGAARVFTVGGVAVPALATLDATLTALLNAAATANATVCVDITADATTGAITAAANVDATFGLCGAVVATASGSGTTYAVAGLPILAAQLSAAEAAALQLALANNTNACVDLVIVDSVITSATARVDACVTVSALTSTSVTLDGVALPLGTGATVAPEVRAGATLGVRLTINATTGAVTLARIAITGCTESGTAAAGGGGALPDTTTDMAADQTPLLVFAGMLASLGAFVVLRSRSNPR